MTMECALLSLELILQWGRQRRRQIIVTRKDGRTLMLCQLGWGLGKAKWRQNKPFKGSCRRAGCLGWGCGGDGDSAGRGAPGKKSASRKAPRPQCRGESGVCMRVLRELGTILPQVLKWCVCVCVRAHAHMCRGIFKVVSMGVAMEENET
jgi:hypothetical protein